MIKAVIFSPEEIFGLAKCFPCVCADSTGQKAGPVGVKQEDQQDTIQ